MQGKLGKNVQSCFTVCFSRKKDLESMSLLYLIWTLKEFAFTLMKLIFTTRSKLKRIKRCKALYSLSKNSNFPLSFKRIRSSLMDSKAIDRKNKEILRVIKWNNKTIFAFQYSTKLKSRLRQHKCFHWILNAH